MMIALATSRNILSLGDDIFMFEGAVVLNPESCSMELELAAELVSEHGLHPEIAVRMAEDLLYLLARRCYEEDQAYQTLYRDRYRETLLDAACDVPE